MSPETTYQKVSRTPAASSVHHIVPSYRSLSRGSLNRRQDSCIGDWTSVQGYHHTTFHLDVRATLTPPSAPLSRARERGRGWADENVFSLVFANTRVGWWILHRRGCVWRLVSYRRSDAPTASIGRLKLVSYFGLLSMMCNLSVALGKRLSGW